MSTKKRPCPSEDIGIHALHFSSQSDKWATPQSYFDAVDSEFRFTLDACATADSAKCEAYYSPSDDGLAQEWMGVVWCNPPYGREISSWLKKAVISAAMGATVVCLIPSRTETAWWHDIVMNASEIRFVRGRLKFGGAKYNAPFPSALVVFRPPVEDAANA